MLGKSSRPALSTTRLLRWGGLALFVGMIGVVIWFYQVRAKRLNAYRDGKREVFAGIEQRRLDDVQRAILEAREAIDDGDSLQAKRALSKARALDHEALHSAEIELLVKEYRKLKQ